MRSLQQSFFIAIIAISLSIGLNYNVYAQATGNVVIVRAFLSTGKIIIYYGSDKKDEEISLKTETKDIPFKELNDYLNSFLYNTMVNTLNKLSKEGYKIISADYEPNAGNHGGYTYILYKE